MEPDSRRSESRGFLSPVRCSEPRESCDSATTGTRISLARAFRPREMEETSWVRFSKLLLAGAVGAGHELEVVDDDEVEAAFLLLEAAGLGAHLGEGDAGGVVDEHLGFHEAFERGVELALVFARQEAGLDLAGVDEGFAGEHAAEEAFLATFRARRRRRLCRRGRRRSGRC